MSDLSNTPDGTDAARGEMSWVRGEMSRVRAGAYDAAWIDASAGAAGDMFLGALLDAGAPLDAMRAAVAAVSGAAADSGAGGEQIDLTARQVRRHGLRATKVDVAISGSPAPRTVAEILALVARAGLEPAVAAFATRVFTVLAAAEARAHGETDPEAAHLHELGALDAIGDVVGTAAALHALGILAPGVRIGVSEVALGSGTAPSRHGTIPVPAPAVLEILADSRLVAVPGEPGRERCTPTGAALLSVLASGGGAAKAGAAGSGGSAGAADAGSAGWPSVPPMRIRSIGVGAGSADEPGHANILRVILGTAVDAGTRADPDRRSPREEELVELEATVDDLDPRAWPEVLDAAVAAGALDAWLIPAVMRKGRPGHVVTALTRPALVDAVARAVFSASTTLGLRIRPTTRRALPRDEVVVQVGGCDVRVKRGFLDGEVVTVQPEYADAEAVARRLGRPVRWVIERASAQAHASAEAQTPDGRER